MMISYPFCSYRGLILLKAWNQASKFAIGWVGEFQDPKPINTEYFLDFHQPQPAL